MSANHTAQIPDFSQYIADRTKDFTGREWVFQAVSDWLVKSDGPPFFLLTGEPGHGKSAIAARLYQFSQGEVSPPNGLLHLTPPFLSASHFCSRREVRWINPHVFSGSLALQIADRFPAFAKALAEKSGERRIIMDVEQKVEKVEGGQVVGIGNMLSGLWTHNRPWLPNRRQRFLSRSSLRLCVTEVKETSST